MLDAVMDVADEAMISGPRATHIMPVLEREIASVPDPAAAQYGRPEMKYAYKHRSGASHRIPSGVGAVSPDGERTRPTDPSLNLADRSTEMVIRRWWIGIGTGLGVAVGLALWLRVLASDFVNTAQRLNSAGHMRAALWLIAVGIVVYLVCVGSQKNALISGIPALVLLTVFAPLIFGLASPDWYPDWLTELTLVSYNIHTPVIIGVLVGATVWTGWHQIRSRVEPSRAMDPTIQTIDG
ncbi:MAG TPA: hypothetical protein VHL52_12485 [Acidimicrobiia bacterium]|nr:hypothetical protein [Acidimicrobiia bacterium]